MPRRRIGAPRREFDPEILSQLVDIRLKEQVPWKALPTRYLELLPTGTREAAPDWRVLQREMMGDLDALIMPTRVHKKMRARLTAEFDKADLGAMMMTVLLARYGEWNLLHSRMLRNAAAAGLQDDVEERLAAPKFTAGDRERMDLLAGEVLSILFRVTELMRTTNIADNSIFKLMESVGGDSPGVRGYAESEEAVHVTKRMLLEVREETVKMLEGVNERHKAAGTGHYRPRPVEESDLIEEGIV